MRDRRLLPRCVFPERPAARPLARRLEQRVVTEAAAPARLERDPAAGRASPSRDPHPARTRWVRHGDRQHADIPSLALRDRDAGELAQQLRVVVRVGRVGTGVSASPNAGAAVQRVDLEPGVVGERRQPRRAGGEAGLDPRIGLERQPVFDGLAFDADLVERDEPRLVDSEEVAELAQLLVGARRDDDAPRGRVGRRLAQRRTGARATDCASNRLARPSLARSSRASIRGRSNGTPSAVPWTST